MRNSNTYAGIGTRFPTEQQRRFCVAAGKYLARHGYCLHTGAAEGVDQIFTQAALEAGGKTVLHIPWPKHEQEFREAATQRFGVAVETRILQTKKNQRDQEAFDSVAQHHPAPAALSWGGLCLHARNYRIVVPAEPVDFVVACPSPRGGGTMQGVRIAESLGVPVVRLDQLSSQEARTLIKRLAGQDG